MKQIWAGCFSFKSTMNIFTCVFISQLPDLKDAEAVQKFFLDEIQQGEEYLSQGQQHVLPLRVHTNDVSCATRVQDEPQSVWKALL